jgi:hypothetical protein
VTVSFSRRTLLHAVGQAELPSVYRDKSHSQAVSTNWSHSKERLAYRYEELDTILQADDGSHAGGGPHVTNPRSLICIAIGYVLTITSRTVSVDTGSLNKRSRHKCQRSLRALVKMPERRKEEAAGVIGREVGR